MAGQKTRSCIAGVTTRTMMDVSFGQMRNGSMDMTVFRASARPATAPTSLFGRIISVYGVLAFVNIGAWVWAFVAFHDYPVLLGTALLAYTFGLRHAVDADHIAAIDNVTRKLMQQGKRPVGVGFFFSLGHSTVVVALTVAIAVTSVAIKDRFSSFASVGGIIGTSVLRLVSLRPSLSRTS